MDSFEKFASTIIWKLKIPALLRLIVPRFTKQLVIGSLFLIVLLGVSGWVWVVTRPKPSCFDAVQNQNEVGVDCGGICTLACQKEPMYKVVDVLQTWFFAVAPNVYDVLGEVENKNLDFGAETLRVEFKLLNASGTVVATRSEGSFILPRQKKFLAIQRIETTEPATAIAMHIEGEQWVEVGVFTGADLLIRDRFYAPNSVATDKGSTASGVLVNASGYDFNRVNIVVVLRSDAGEMLAAGTTDVRTLKNGEHRAFQVQWPQTHTQSINRVDMEAYTNLLANENFMTRYGTLHGRFQEEVPTPAAGVRRR